MQATPPNSPSCSRSSPTGCAKTRADWNRRCSAFVGNTSYGLDTLRTDLARFRFLLGDDGTQLFEQDQP